MESDITNLASHNACSPEDALISSKQLDFARELVNYSVVPNSQEARKIYNEIDKQLKSTHVNLVENLYETGDDNKGSTGSFWDWRGLEASDSEAPTRGDRAGLNEWKRGHSLRVSKASDTGTVKEQRQDSPSIAQRETNERSDVFNKVSPSNPITLLEEQKAISPRLESTSVSLDQGRPSSKYLSSPSDAAIPSDNMVAQNTKSNHPASGQEDDSPEWIESDSVSSFNRDTSDDSGSTGKETPSKHTLSASQIGYRPADYHDDAGDVALPQLPASFTKEPQWGSKSTGNTPPIQHPLWRAKGPYQFETSSDSSRSGEETVRRALSSSSRATSRQIGRGSDLMTPSSTFKGRRGSSSEEGVASPPSQWNFPQQQTAERNRDGSLHATSSDKSTGHIHDTFRSPSPSDHDSQLHSPTPVLAPARSYGSTDEHFQPSTHKAPRHPFGTLSGTPDDDKPRVFGTYGPSDASGTSLCRTPPMVPGQQKNSGEGAYSNRQKFTNKPTYGMAGWGRGLYGGDVPAGDTLSESDGNTLSRTDSPEISSLGHTYGHKYKSIASSDTGHSFTHESEIDYAPSIQGDGAEKHSDAKGNQHHLSVFPRTHKTTDDTLQVPLHPVKSLRKHRPNRPWEHKTGRAPRAGEIDAGRRAGETIEEQIARHNQERKERGYDDAIQYMSAQPTPQFYTDPDTVSVRDATQTWHGHSAYDTDQMSFTHIYERRAEMMGYKPGVDTLPEGDRADVFRAYVVQHLNREMVKINKEAGEAMAAIRENPRLSEQERQEQVRHVQDLTNLKVNEAKERTGYHRVDDTDKVDAALAESNARRNEILQMQQKQTITLATVGRGLAGFGKFMLGVPSDPRLKSYSSRFPPGTFPTLKQALEAQAVQRQMGRQPQPQATAVPEGARQAGLAPEGQDAKGQSNVFSGSTLQNSTHNHAPGLPTEAKDSDNLSRASDASLSHLPTQSEMYAAYQGR
ncbi:hypothetical protein BS50DRAFT_91839 [Corynespora cassiicola Philippines]|uniref:Uncharacterized protein n=1 Tax=Corynespora cassiicola Philippines TaxID=1448308 RepID=A0A2T2NEL4_CORCC|nr:hypothetical protein BS50DRAFT_91839 [Corynespora cassiicola Philippines]